MLERLVHLRAHGTSPRAGVMAGLTTCMSVASIIFVNPGVLREAGPPFAGVLPATCVPAALGTSTATSGIESASGIALGFIVYPLTQAGSGRARAVTPLTWIPAVIFLFRYSYV